MSDGGDDNHSRRECGGPPGWGGFDQTDLPPTDQWTYHAVADVVLAHSLVRSLPQVDAARTGLTGIGWGGYLTCIAAGVDPRFRFAAPVCGCGFLGLNSAPATEVRAMGPKNAQYWLGLWDPAIYLPRATMPILWLSGTNDPACPLDAFQESYELPRTSPTLCVRVRMPRREEADAGLEEIHAFAEAMLDNGPPLAQVDIRRREGQKACVAFTGQTPIVKVELNYTTDTGPWQARNWQTAAALLDTKAGRATGILPKEATAYFFNLTDQRGLVVSTEHVGVVPRAATGGKNATPTHRPKPLPSGGK
jgi:hypothetical protein